MRRKPRLLVARVSRFAEAAQALAVETWPDAERRLLSMPAGTRLTPVSLFTTAAGRRALAWRPDIVVTQWWNDAGDGHAAVDAALLLVQPRGFHVVFEDGSARWVGGVSRIARAWRRRVWTIRNVAIVAALACATPVAWLAQFGADRLRAERTR